MRFLYHLQQYRILQKELDRITDAIREVRGKKELDTAAKVLYDRRDAVARLITKFENQEVIFEEGDQ